MSHTKSESMSEPAIYPFREYVASMAAQLAELARNDGDTRLAEALEGAAAMARDSEKDLV